MCRNSEGSDWGEISENNSNGEQKEVRSGDQELEEGDLVAMEAETLAGNLELQLVKNGELMVVKGGKERPPKQRTVEKKNHGFRGTGEVRVGFWRCLEPGFSFPHMPLGVPFCHTGIHLTSYKNLRSNQKSFQHTRE